MSSPTKAELHEELVLLTIGSLDAGVWLVDSRQSPSVFVE